MNKLIICRTSQTDVQTIGEESRVEDEKGATIFSFVSLELPCRDNEPQVSCIPAGRYFFKKCLGTDKIPYEHLRIEEVTGRSGIAVHRANYVTQLRGCIAVGRTLADINGDGLEDVSSSEKTLDALLLHLPEEGIMDIIEKF